MKQIKDFITCIFRKVADIFWIVLLFLQLVFIVFSLWVVFFSEDNFYKTIVFVATIFNLIIGLRWYKKYKN